MRRAARPWHMEITVEGLNLERFVRQAGEIQIPMTSLQRRSPRRLTALVRENDYYRLQELSLKGGWKIRAGQRRGTGKAAEWLQRRWLLVALMMMMAVVLTAVSQVMWQVDITGAGTYEADIRLVLEEMGIFPPKWRSQVDLASLQEALEWRYPRIAWFECGWRGGTLVIRVEEGVLPKQESDYGRYDVVAVRDAIVHRVVTKAGTPVIAPGDFVRRGDILIKGEERTSNGEVKAVPASGSVTGRVWEGAAVQMSCREVRTEYTGNVQIVRTVRTPWFDMWRLPECPYDCYDISVSVQTICGMFLPVQLYTEIRMEAVQTPQLRDLEQVKADADAAARRKLQEKLDDPESLIDIWGNCSMIDTENVLSLAVGELLTEIGTQRSRSDMAASD